MKANTKKAFAVEYFSKAFARFVFCFGKKRTSFVAAAMSTLAESRIFTLGCESRTALLAHFEI